MANHPNRSTAAFALIVADPNSNSLGEILSLHRSREAAEGAMRKLQNARWAYVAAKRTDGAWQHRVEATY